MEVDEAYRHVAGSITFDLGRFYSPGTSVGLGKGKIYDCVLYPLYSLEQRLFQSVQGLVFVLTHECDIEPENARAFNEELLICPIIRLDILVEIYQTVMNEDQLISFLANLGARNISRLIYLPPFPGILGYGGVLYLNQIASTHISTFEDREVAEICAVTAFGLDHVEYALENHLLRPKDDRLAFGAEQP